MEACKHLMNPTACVLCYHERARSPQQAQPQRPAAHPQVAVAQGARVPSSPIAGVQHHASAPIASAAANPGDTKLWEPPVHEPVHERLPRRA